MKRGRASGPKLIDDALLRRWPLPALEEGADKKTRGDVLVVAGSVQMPGAGLLAAIAALRAGAGRIQLVVPRAVSVALAVVFPEARVIGVAQTRDGNISPSCARGLHRELQKCRALLIGPGMLGPQVAASLLRETEAVGGEATVVLDAGAVQVLRSTAKPARPTVGPLVVTPHAGEMAELWGCPADEVKAAPLALAREAARSLDAVFVLKGPETFIVDPDGQAFYNLAGNVGLATAGSGDTLAGLIAGLAARGATPMQAAAWGVYIHARAGEALARAVGPLGYLARELLAEIPRQLARPASRKR